MLSVGPTARLFAGIGALVVAFGCSSTTTGGGGPTADQACTDSAKARCDRIQACSPAQLGALYGDQASCETRVKASCVSSLAAPNNANTPTHTAGCTAAIPGWTCNDFLANANPPDACSQLMGSVAVGGACYAAGQCQSGFCAHTTSACGACAAAPTAGQPCTPAHQCALGLACGPDGNCAAAGQTGATCGPTQTCAAGNICVMGTCKAVNATAASGRRDAVRRRRWSGTRAAQLQVDG